MLMEFIRDTEDDGGVAEAGGAASGRPIHSARAAKGDRFEAVAREGGGAARSQRDLLQERTPLLGPRVAGDKEQEEQGGTIIGIRELLSCSAD
jgi:hypothetical protein